ncbi:MAG: DUF3515 domain-containing protein [Actinomycetota bacterium]
MPRPRRLLRAGTLLLTALALAACSPAVHLEPADEANDPLCAEVTVRLANATSVADQERRWTDAQATAAWGDPVSIILSCGLAAPAPTSELQCVTLEGVDWLVDTSETPMLRVTTYGRDPAAQIYMDTSVVSSNDVLSSQAIASAVSTLPQDGRCTAPDELPEDREELPD